MKIIIERPRDTFIHLEIGNYSSSGSHTSIIEGVIIALLDIIGMWLNFRKLNQPEHRTRFSHKDR